MSKRPKARESRLSPKLLIGIILALLFATSLCLRVYLPYDKVFSGDWIKFTGVDAYYHMRLVDNLVHNFPRLAAFDPYLLYPGGAEVGGGHFFDWLLAGIIWVIGLGSPTQHTIDVISVYFPAVLGALTVIPVYFIGKELFGRWAGMLSAGLIALLPGEFLGRSILGFTDHDVANTLFTTITILFLILAIKTANQRQLTFSHLKRRDWATSAKPVIYSLLTGISLGIYLLTWAGGLLFVFLIWVYFIIQFVIDHLKGKSTDYLCLVGVISFFIAATLFLPISTGMLYPASLLIALLTPLVLNGISRLMESKKIKPAYYPLTLIGLGLAGLGLFYLIKPSLLSSMLNLFTIFTPRGAQLTTIEVQPLISFSYDNPFRLAWGNFTTGFFLSLVSLGILIYLVIKHGSAEKNLLVVWSLVILATTLGQRRFASYLAVNVALLTGYLSWQFLRLAGFEKSTPKAVKVTKEAGDKKARPKNGGFHITTRQVNMALAVLIVFLIVFSPIFLFPTPKTAPLIPTASGAPFAPSDAWISSLYWLKENTPEPFGNPDFYYHLESHKYRSLSLLKRTVPNPSGDPDFYYQLEKSYPYPESAYGVLAWWDYGYWITRIAHRIPNANPGQDARALTSVASFFTSQDERSANEIAQELGSAYIIIDYETATNKFWAIVMWAEKERSEFFDTYYAPQETQLLPVQLYYPEYYHSLSTRLYNFDGKAVTPESSMVISYQEGTDEKGTPYKIITSAEQFENYEEAEAYLLSQETANYKIVSNNPFISPVPLEALEHYQLIHSSNSTITLPSGATIPKVKIFEYID